jgi:membrane carboxypeptidase/penicillin-binding protein PbpC
LAEVREVRRARLRSETPSTPLEILTPVKGAEFVLTREEEADRIRLRASLEDLHWYLNGRYLGHSDAAKPQHLQLAAGDHTLTAMAQSGERATVTFTVNAPYRPERFE